MATLGFLASQSSNVLNIAGAAVNIGSVTRALLSPETKNENLPKGINDFMFDVSLSETINLTAEITDHYTEANVSIQDHVALQPVKVTLTGQVGELISERDQIFEYAEQAVQKLMFIPGMKPEQAQRAVSYLSAYNEAKRQVNQALKIYNTATKLFSANQVSQTKQQKAYTTLESFYNSRTLCSIVTPWRNFQNMVIENLTITQNPESKDYSEITVTLKQINSLEIWFEEDLMPEVSNAQRSPVKNQGIVKGNQSAGAYLYDQGKNSFNKVVGQ